jgi:hypothetical protein
VNALPLGKIVLVCDDLVRVPAGASFPYTLGKVCVVAMMGDGQRDVRFHVRIVDAGTMEIIRQTEDHVVSFSGRHRSRLVLIRVTSVVFPAAGVYLVELFCESEFVDDQRIEILNWQESTMRDSDEIPVDIFVDRPNGPSISHSSEPPAQTFLAPDTLAIFDSHTNCKPSTPRTPPTLLSFDVLLADSSGDLITIYSAGRPLDRLRPRTVSILASDSQSPLTSIAILKRLKGSDPVAFRTFRFSQDLRGTRVIIRFADVADENSLVVEFASPHPDMAPQS